MAKKQKKTPSAPVLKRLFQDMGKSKRRFGATLLIVAIAKFSLAMAPSIANRITDTMTVFAEQGHTDWGRLLMLCGLLALFYLIGYGAACFVTRSMVRISQDLVERLRNRCGEKLNRLSIALLDSLPL